ncbi:tRNA-splicing endonuclease subunit Sen2 isoform X2 [Pelmatolapia mariae]|uniref:tRNA-splicing endonuclease subunit Sen2 isoform X2 n=1 Tax=Pelmatolapia mariae TaxID=158779 RepID=UPI002FE59369
MYADFRAPRRRLRVTEELEAPLPLSPRERSHFQAELLNQHVLVCDPQHSQKIHDQGYFGKGVLSRSRPEHSISNQWEQHEGVFLPVVSQARYEELLKWAGSALSAQGWDEEAVHQTLLRLSQPIQMEDVRNQMGGGGEAEENGERGKEEPEQEGGVSPQMKRSRRGSEVEPEAKRSCSSEQDSDSSLDCDPDSDPDPAPAPLVPGPGFLLVVSDSETGGGVREVRRTPFFLSEYLQLSLEEAFFLVYSLGCLSVYLQQEPLSIVQLWRTFRSLRPDFVSSYAVYHHFRSKGVVQERTTFLPCQVANTHTQSGDSMEGVSLGSIFAFKVFQIFSVLNS